MLSSLLAGSLGGNTVVTDGVSLQRASNAKLRSYFVLSLNELFNEQSIRRWRETHWRSYVVTVICIHYKDAAVWL